MSELDQLQLNFDANGLAILNIALAIVMFGVALNIRPGDFKILLLEPRAALLGILSQFLFLPALTFGLVYLLKPEPSLALGMFLVAACPGGNISNYMSFLAKGNAALSFCLTAFASVFALFLTPFNFHLWAGLYPETSGLLRSVALEPAEVFQLILLILGIPLILGMLCRHYLPKWSMALERILKPLSFFVFVALVFLALANNFQQFLDYVHYVVLLVLAHNTMALLLGYSLGKIGKLSLENVKTLTLETGIQNSGLGLVLIFTFFSGMGGMALVAAWWGIWHIISGLSLATWWGFRKSVPEKA